MSHGVASKAFRHEALFYSGEGEFVTGVAPFVRQAFRFGEPVLVVVPGHKIEMLRWALGGHAAKVRFEDMTQAGRNPGRIISAWADFAAEQRSAGQLRGVGEPVWADRTADELAECERHEGLLNIAFAEAPLWLVCPYDTSTLDPSVVDRATRTHPVASSGTPRPRRRAALRLPPRVPDPLDGPLSDPPPNAARIDFDSDRLGEVRTLVAQLADRHGLDAEAAEGLVLAINEVATNSVRHGGGRGVLQGWATPSSVICEVRDQGVIGDPLVGRFRPEPTEDGGFGLWLANQFCDLVQIRSGDHGSIVRLHMRRHAVV